MMENEQPQQCRSEAPTLEQTSAVSTGDFPSQMTLEVKVTDPAGLAVETPPAAAAAAAAAAAVKPNNNNNSNNNNNQPQQLQKMEKAPLASSRRSLKGDPKKHFVVKKMTALSTIQRQQVDKAFQGLFGYPWGQTPTVVIHADHCKDRRYLLLKRIFGAKSAAQILHNVKLKDTDNNSNSIITTTVSTTQTQTQLMHLSHDTTNELVEQPQQQSYHASFQTTARAVPVPEPVSSVSAAPLPVAHSAVAAAEVASAMNRCGGGGGAGNGAGGVDALLQQMQGKKATSTIMKTAMDWESFKEESGVLGEKLEQHAESKGAYLKRQDFLTRVDHRRFEQERLERERNRTKNSNN